MRHICTLLIIAAGFMTGCAAYVTPGRGADLTAVAPQTRPDGKANDDPIAGAFDQKPMARFPSSIAVARIQAPGYSSQTARGWGRGRYSLVTTRDIEKPDQFQRLASWPGVQGLAPLNRLIVDDYLETDRPLRQAAAKLHADMLLLYTLDTQFNTEDKAVPLSVVSLGLSPNRQVRLITTASAVLLDTRTGFVYGLAEATAQQNKITNAWQNDQAVDETRRENETKAFGNLVDELEKTWTGVVQSHGGNPAPARAQ